MEVVLIRRMAGNQERSIFVDFDAVMKGEAPDYFLQPDDAITLRVRPADRVKGDTRP